MSPTNDHANALNSKSNYDLCRILVLGESGVGKSSLISRYADQQFTELFVSTIGVDFKFKSIDINEKQCKLQIWDTSGQERFRTITSNFYRGAHGVLLVFDVTLPESFAKVDYWYKDMKRYSHENIPVLLVATKCDVEAYMRQVDTQTGKNLADSLGFAYIETSSKTGLGVNEAFEKLTVQIMERRLVKKVDHGINLKQKEQKRDCPMCSIQ